MAKRESKRGARPSSEGWLSKAPAQLPPFELMCEEVAASPAAIARHLGVSERTLATYIKRGAPRAVQLSMFYETQWGRGYVACDAENRARLMTAYVSSLRAELARLSELVSKLSRIGDFGAANDPAHEAVLLQVRHLESVVVECLQREAA